VLLFVPRETWDWNAVPYFIFSGVVGTAAGRLFRVAAIEKVGALVSASILNMTPLVATGLAIAILGEHVTLPILAGTLVIVAGTILLSLSGRYVGFASRHLIYPFLAATCFGVVRAEPSRRCERFLASSSAIHPRAVAPASSPSPPRRCETPTTPSGCSVPCGVAKGSRSRSLARGKKPSSASMRPWTAYRSPTGSSPTWGGASLQLSRVRARRLVSSASLPLGAVRATRRFSRQDPPRPRELQAIRRAIRQALVDAVPPADRGEVIVGLGGIVRTLARIHLRSQDGDRKHRHGLRLAQSDVTAIRERLEGSSRRQRRKIRGL
jgi:hypothetical protein